MIYFEVGVLEREVVGADRQTDGQATEKAVYRDAWGQIRRQSATDKYRETKIEAQTDRQRQKNEER